MTTSAVDRFRAAASAHGIDVAVSRFPEGTRTAADAAAAVGCGIGAIVKSLVFIATDGDGAERPVMALVSGSNRADVTKLIAHFGAVSVRQANADEVRAATGFAIGGTPPLGHANQVAMVVDQDLLDFDEVWAAAGTPDSVWPIAPQRLVDVLGAPVAEVRQ